MQISSLDCPITLQRMVDPVIAPDGHTYERAAIERWIREHHTSPQNPSMRIDSITKLIPNRIVRDLVEEAAAAPEEVIVEELISSDVRAKIQEIKATIHTNSVNTDQSIVHIEPPNHSKVCGSSHIITVIDVSGSMCTEASCKDENGHENKTGLTILDVVKFATLVIAKSLTASDKLSIVTYSDDAQTILGPTNMNDVGKDAVERVLQNVQPQGRTNLWAGIKTACGLATSSAAGKGFVSSVFVLTDGSPNIHPALGYVRSLERLMKQSELFGSISTFGFGYNLDSNLLVDIARIGGGYFSFIPDSGFVGTCFINALANARCAFGVNPILKIKSTGSSGLRAYPTGDGKLVVEADGDSAIVRMTPLRFGAPIDIILRKELIRGNVSLELSFFLVDGSEVSIPLTADSSDNGISDLFHTTRVNFVKKVYEVASHESYAVRVQENRDAFSPPQHARAARTLNKDLNALCQDMEGQATEAISQSHFYNRWGGKYLLSLAGAHLHQFCNNFKDPGVQVYGNGKLFVSLQEGLNDIFEKIPPPKPSVRESSRGGGYGYGSGSSSSRRSQPTPVITSMTNTFNNRQAVCVHGKTQVIRLSESGEKKMRNLQVQNLGLSKASIKKKKLHCFNKNQENQVKVSHSWYHNIQYSEMDIWFNAEDIQTVNIAEVKKCDRVLTESGTFAAVQCVVETASNRPFDLVQVNDLLVTPFHPVKIGTEWKFPLYHSNGDVVAKSDAYSVFNLILEKSERSNAVIMNGVPSITLGHGRKDNAVLRHEFFGTDQVVRDVMKIESALTYGHVVLNEKDIKRGSKNRDICAIEVSTHLPASDFMDMPSTEMRRSNRFIQKV
mmetsp:Transcript_17246/g.25312  ORF Transcript_17246/g.25312 Transcript_17246/m.25312 type:complete len:842 (-) Transcript_17246:298-2823(-)